MLNQLGQVVHFWKHGRQASFLLETKQDGGANLNIRFQLPSASTTIAQSSTPTHYKSTPIFPKGVAPRTTLEHQDYGKPESHPAKRSPSYYCWNYRQGILYGASKAAQNLPPPKPNTLRELATSALEEDNNNPVGEILSILFGKRSSKPKKIYCFLLSLDLSSSGG